MDFICINRRGDVFVEFYRVPESEVSVFQPLTHALVVGKSAEGFLLMFNIWKQKWEVPGGYIDPGETPRQAAGRELLEETSQQAELHFAGIMKFQLQPDGRIEHGALFLADIQQLKPFTPNEEASKIHFWDRLEDIGDVDEIDQKLLDFYTL
ncbi:NUDIX domain-containing protein [Deinococcus cellulosilyticus]|uniref:DNA mismatch repair protein MutT n=1 Tax=Deinococcus cellulosilyticus (strain DSM 18568 / NBRC 106333 / KACC 11606 / 5516J-15) TaxID=1223518 RepID=A0A511N3U9_DEIC1|nr:NUDIX domain-containing protein [Deinococcus cellulosilyticus]GEM47549.1 DNA mismatch repair protein MutT [Deinococcus cellulosilyticus NBRC 106333 = KACC 11606]